MSDLISRSALIEQLREAQQDDIVKCVIGLVQTQPTAYDVEKVVAEVCDVLFVYDIPTHSLDDIIRNGGKE